MRHIRLDLCIFTICLLLTELGAGEARDRANRDSPHWLLPVPELRANPGVPTLEQVVGHGWARDISSHAEIERYVRALADAAPDRARLETYGRSYEGRTLYYLIISSPRNLGRLEELRKDNLRLADPRLTPPEEARKLFSTAPGFLWLAYNIHGNETSTAQAAMLTAYHLLADRRPETTKSLERLVVIIDPLQNPDGRDRFVNVYRETRGRFPQSEPAASEHTERWPSGRFNHYLFDMNRDWFLHSQVETRGKVEAYLHWRPQIFVDAHEMGRSSNYYFAPSADPVNPYTLPRQRRWLYRLGRHQAEWFDRYGFPYTTREIFDAFYPGYGSEWPNLHGVMGVLWEQAGVRGLVVDRTDETQLRFHQAVRHHYVSALATIEVAAEHREELLEDYYDALLRGVQLGEEGPVRDFFLLEGKQPSRAARLARLLLRNGAEVFRVRQPLRLKCMDIHNAVKAERVVPAGSYHVPVDQPAGRVVRVLLDRHVDMGEEFIERQLRRKERRLSDEIYDVTAWSLPLAFGVTCLQSGERVDVQSEPWNGDRRPAEVVGGRAKVAYLVPGNDDGTIVALASWLQAGYRVHVTDRPLKLGGVDFPRGTLVLRVHENPESLHREMQEAAARDELEVHAVDTGFVTEGAHLGGPHVKWVRPPKALLLVDRPTAYSVGHTWYLFDQVLGYPVTRVAGRHLGRVDLRRFNVLILPAGSYSGSDAPTESFVARVKEWVERGGTLILVSGGASWATRKEVQLLASAPVKKETPWSGKAAEPPQPASGQGVTASPPSQESETITETPDPVPGAFLRATVYDDHWLTYGYGPEVDVLLSGSLILKPLKPTAGRNLVTFAARDKLLTSGFCWPQTLDLLAGTPYVLYQRLGRGHIVAFTDDPNYRAMYPAVQRFFLNAVFFGPGQ